MSPPTRRHFETAFLRSDKSPKREEYRPPLNQSNIHEIVTLCLFPTAKLTMTAWEASLLQPDVPWNQERIEVSSTRRHFDTEFLRSEKSPE
jgi:hypothetical protein